MKRRALLKAGVAGAAAFTFSGLTLPTRRSYAAVVSVNFTAEAALKPITIQTTPPQAGSVMVWQYRDTTVAGAKGPGALASGLRVAEGDQVTVNLTNNLNRPVGFVIPGVSVTPTTTTAPGATQAYTFTAPVAGSYFYTDSPTDLTGRAMGLAGPLVVMPADGSLRLAAGLPLFNSQYTLFFQELDSRLNIAIANGGTGATELAAYAPDFYFANGVNYPVTASDPDTLVRLVTNQTTALRLISGGLQLNSMHFHGYHVDVTIRNTAGARVLETNVVEKDTVPVDPGECVDVMLRVTQPGRYELHNHFLPAVTGNGFYPYGAMVMMDAV